MSVAPDLATAVHDMAVLLTAMAFVTASALAANWRRL